LNLRSERRRASRQWEWEEQTALAERLYELLDPDCTFWTAVENTPWSQLAGIMRKRRGVRSGLPDLLVWHRGQSIAIELKSLFGRVSAAQRQVRDAMLKAGVQWWCCRTATAALTVLYRAGVPLSGWEPPPLEVWEEPVSDPDHMIWAPHVLAQWREDKKLQRERAKARRAALSADAERSTEGQIMRPPNAA